MHFPTKIRALVLAIISFTLVLMNCCNTPAPFIWRIVLDDEYSKPGVDYSLYRSLAILRFEADLLEDEIAERITHLVSEEFRKKRYNIIRPQKFHSLLEDSQISISKLWDPRVLQKIKNNFNIFAIIRCRVNKYEIETKIWPDPMTFADPGYTEYQIINICDISLAIEMIDTQDGTIIWSSSVSCNSGKIKGSTDRLLRRMIKKCLEKIPKH